MRCETEGYFLVGTVILGFLKIFKKCQASSAFEALNSLSISRFQRDVRPPVQKRRRPRAFSSVSPGDSDIPSSCEMKYEPTFKTLQGNLAFFWVRASQGPFHLRQKTQSPSHIITAEGRLILRCLWKVGLPLQLKTGNHSHPEMIWGTRNVPQVAVLKLMILYTWDGCLRESLVFPKGSQGTCFLWCGSRDGYGANAREIGLISAWFRVLGATSPSWGDISVLQVLWQCCWGLSGVQSSKPRVLTCFIGKTQLLCTQCRVIGPHLPAMGKSHGFSQVAAGTWGLFYSYGGDIHSTLEFVQRFQDNCLGTMDTSGM